ncbi:metalloregulator ArsR/SmtB family transcription factor [Pontixanthobacter gangjinensis]|uniref:Metalloregulator ArsR/SmtB family transcription factor n=1 Tax=Pontixanthobacter gangjinensis TaxID=1028742 RepID=A0A6I4STQ2_9SPHN|nr:metalloregulator ArsR/SmtB family transcription factor [Pontixanthobacter gangjinensis]MXO57922.1 metalloregulator ArsR/SmtB family transcription factor [Pontixanthobacter gangjinensis]
MTRIDSTANMAAMTANSEAAAALMRALSNQSRLLVLCHLAAAGELPVGALVERVGISQSALSQHLAKLREQGLVAFRRESQTLYYRVDDPRALQVLELLHSIYCPELV